MLRGSDGALVETLLHELVHATVYRASDADFNEALRASSAKKAARALLRGDARGRGRPARTRARRRSERRRARCWWSAARSSASTQRSARRPRAATRAAPNAGPRSVAALPPCRARRPGRLPASGSRTPASRSPHLLGRHDAYGASSPRSEATSPHSSRGARCGRVRRIRARRCSAPCGEAGLETAAQVDALFRDAEVVDVAAEARACLAGVDARVGPAVAVRAVLLRRIVREANAACASRRRR